VTTETPTRSAEPVQGFWRLVPEPSLDVVRAWAWASVVANIGIVVTGGLVRLTGSGLGCPTWPQCTDQSYVPHSALGMHGAIEFGNRLLGFVVAAIAIGTWVVVMRYRPKRRDLRRLATAAALGVPLQAVIGGISVLTGLNPWIVSAHFLVSPVIVTFPCHCCAGPAPALTRTRHPSFARWQPPVWWRSGWSSVLAPSSPAAARTLVIRRPAGTASTKW
jgi:cytochrome c oxidase assembly protein subunit 15